MPLTVGDRAIRPLTADDVMRMVDVGILDEDDRVELLGGVLTAVSPQDPPHAVVTQRLTRWLAPLMVEGSHDVRVQLPFRVPDHRSLPEPDLAVVVRDDAYVDHPRDALLLVEVAESSRRIDTIVKPPLYAAAGVPEYWVVDVALRQLVRLTQPAASGYGRRGEQPADGTAKPIALDVEPLDLGALFAGL